jgi:hypothetical protein
MMEFESLLINYIGIHEGIDWQLMEPFEIN